jgi:hypothetical protein
MRPLDLIRNAFRASREVSELRDLVARLGRHAGSAEETRDQLCERLVERTLRVSGDDRVTPLMEALWRLCQELLAYEGHFYVPDIDLSRSLSTAEIWELRSVARRRLEPFERQEAARRIEKSLELLVHSVLHEQPPDLPASDGEIPSFSVPMYAWLGSPAQAVEAVITTALTEFDDDGPFAHLRERLHYNLLDASDIDPSRAEESRKRPIMPTRATDKSPQQLVQTYLRGTPFTDFLNVSLPFSIPFSARFEHMHVIGGSGHGKTQLLHCFILRDLMQLVEGRGSLVVIDSQGDMIRAIMRLAELSPAVEGSLADRVVLIDPNDVEHPPCLNLFDFGLDRLERYSAVEREKLINGAIALYEYMFGALLGADLTQRQGVIFRYLARLMMVVPGATIHTLREFMEEPEATRPYLSKLDPTSRHFFESQFFSGAFDDTRQQILTRLWGVLSNSVLARMFSNPRNKLDLFEAMNRGSLILINTAKDLLKQEGCEILGRFFVAMISHAAQERASIPADRRRATFVYIDEAQDYFDKSVEQLLNQARKYKVGLVLAHQNLGQFEPRLMAAVMASTAIKLAGGVSAKDASALGKEMRCEPEFLQGCASATITPNLRASSRTSRHSQCSCQCHSARWKLGRTWVRSSSSSCSRTTAIATARVTMIVLSWDRGHRPSCGAGSSLGSRRCYKPFAIPKAWASSGRRGRRRQPSRAGEGRSPRSEAGPLRHLGRSVPISVPCKPLKSETPDEGRRSPCGSPRHIQPSMPVV